MPKQSLYTMESSQRRRCGPAFLWHLLVSCQISVLSAGPEVESLPSLERSNLAILAPWSGQAVTLGGDVEVSVRVKSFHDAGDIVSHH